MTSPSSWTVSPPPASPPAPSSEPSPSPCGWPRPASSRPAPASRPPSSPPKTPPSVRPAPGELQPLHFAVGHLLGPQVAAKNSPQRVQDDIHRPLPLVNAHVQQTVVRLRLVGYLHQARVVAGVPRDEHQHIGVPPRAVDPGRHGRGAVAERP